MRTLAIRTLAFLLAGGIAAAQTLVDGRLRFSTWASGLSSPTTFCWIGPGEMLVIQKSNGQVRWIKDGTILGTALDLHVNSFSERGGLGIAADPDFANNGYVYVYYSASSTGADSSSSGGWADNRVERYTWNGSTLGSPFGPLVAFPFDASQSNGANHDGGVIRFGPDGKLFGQTGDLNRGRFGAGNERVEQNTATSGSASVGGIFRFETDGTIPADNPFTGESDTALHLWWSYGLRNGFGMTFDPLTGELWNTENGPNVYDEVCRVPMAMNSGWLKIMGPDGRDATYFENGNTAYDEGDLTVLAGSSYLDPELSFKTPIGLTSICFLASKLFPADIQDDCILGDNNTGNLFLCDMRSSRTSFNLPTGLGDKVADTTAERNKLQWGTGWGVTTDLQMGHDGYLYVVNLLNGRVVQIRPVADEVDPARWAIDPGSQVSGTPANAEESDDKVYSFSDVTLNPSLRPYRIGAEFVLQPATPATLTLEIETRWGRMGTPQGIEAFSVAHGRWVFVAAGLVGTSDVAEKITLSPPADFIDPTTRTVRVRFGAWPLPGKPAPRRQTVFVDVLRLIAAYP